MSDEQADVVQNLVAEWLQWASADLKVAKLTDDERIAPQIAAFHFRDGNAYAVNYEDYP